MEYSVKMDFEKDFIEILVAELKAYGFTIDSTEKHEDIKSKYFNFKYRLIPAKKRTILKSNIFYCPTEQQAGLDEVIQIIEKGESLYSHFSTGLKNLNFNDDMLNDWGIYHLHLGINQHATKPEFVERTGPVLYCKFDDDHAYFLDVKDHGHWTDKDLVQIIHDNWPNTISNNKIDMGAKLEYDFNTNDIKSLRKAGLNSSLTMNDGTCYFPIGSGYTVNKIAIDVLENIIDFNDFLEELKNKIQESKDLVGEKLKSKYGFKGLEMSFKLFINEEEIKLIEMNTMVGFPVYQFPNAKRN
jgi:hypothetical protein